MTPNQWFAFLAALLSSLRLRISSSSSSMALSILAPRDGSLPCILAGRVGSCSPAICSAVFFLPLPSVGSFWSLAAARRLAMLRSSSAYGGQNTGGERRRWPTSFGMCGHQLDSLESFSLWEFSFPSSYRSGWFSSFSEAEGLRWSPAS